LNLAGLARAEGDLALALTHLEAAVDMGRRAGSLLAVQGALINLANLDLYLGRYARARASVDSLAENRKDLSPIQSASLFGLEAELAARAGDTVRGAELYEKSAGAWDAQGRLLDAAEARLERILVLSREQGASAGTLAKDLSEVEERVQGTLGEHEALAELVRGALAAVDGNENAARAAFDKALDRAEKAGRREWSWLALEMRARLLAAQGSSALARRDVEAALAILEETASKLPRDLREVFWNDPRRRALRQAHVATHAFVGTAHTVNQQHQRGSPAIRGRTTTIGAPMPAEDRLVRIFEITRELASERDLDRLLTRVTDHAIALTAAERGFVLLARSDGKLHAHAARDRSGELATEAHVQFSQSVATKVVQTGEPVITESARTDDRLAKAASVHQLMIQAIACVPIRSADPVAPVIGALYVETRGGGGVRFSEEISTLSAFADQAAIAIESARLIDENRKRAEELARANVELEAARDKLAEALGRRTEQLATVRRDLKQVRAELRSHFGYAGLVGTSAPMRKLYAVIERIKDTDVPVLISGESGVGKEVVARALHASGARAKRAFLGVNCGAIPENLLESELFGNVRGAFTGAERDRNGLFREADGGTLLLDEVGELPMKMQAALLRVLQEKCVRPVGAAKEEPVDVRVVAATNRDLQKMVEEGSFREDLFYRLHVIELPVPPLRARLDDLPPLIDHFMGLFAVRYRRERKSVARDALRALTAFEWPGNVRQLEHVLLNAWLMSEGSELTVDDFELPGAPRASIAPPSPRPVDPSPKGGGGGGGASARSRAEFKDAERERILAALAASNWNRVKAAKMIGLPRRTFYRRLKEFGIV
ncbi:MAG: sigma-54-dependent Fis family transcriptional regulator, partial [Polyangiaceae bacterium]